MKINIIKPKREFNNNQSILADIISNINNNHNMDNINENNNGLDSLIFDNVNTDTNNTTNNSNIDYNDCTIIEECVNLEYTPKRMSNFSQLLIKLIVDSNVIPTDFKSLTNTSINKNSINATYGGYCLMYETIQYKVDSIDIKRYDDILLVRVISIHNIKSIHCTMNSKSYDLLPRSEISNDSNIISFPFDDSTQFYSHLQKGTTLYLTITWL